MVSIGLGRRERREERGVRIDSQQLHQKKASELSVRAFLLAIDPLIAHSHKWYDGAMTNRNTKNGIILSYLVVLLPAALWAVGHPPSSNFISLQSNLDGLAKVLGIVGVSLFAWNLILSARISWIEKQFGGLDKLYKVHHVIGGLAFMAMLVHPLLLSIKYASLSLIAAYNFILPSLSDLGLLAGKLVLSGMVVVLFITFYIYVSHERFIWIHRLTGVLYIVAVYHFLFVAQSDVRQIPALLAYLVLLSTVAVGLFAYRYFAGSVKPRHRYAITNIADLGGAWELSMKPTAKRNMPHKAGQFAFLTFVSQNLPQQTHPFSVSAAEGEEGLRFVIKNLGDFTAELGKLKVGDKVFVEGPFGTFNYNNMPRTKQVWIAGGIGITPFLAMARTLKQAAAPGIEAYLFYSVADMSQAFGAQELQAIAAELKGVLSFTLHDSSKQGYLSAELVQKQVPDVSGCEVMLCGPKGMMHALEEQFVAAGVGRKHIQYEEFSLL